MAYTNLTFRKEDHKIGKNIVADLFVSTNANYTRQIARHQIESGANVGDHIVKDPISVTIRGLMTTSPIDYKVLYTTPDFVQRVVDVYEELLAIWNDTTEDTIIDIVDGDKEYKNMCLVNLGIPTDEENGDALYFDAVFEELLTIRKGFVDAKYLKEGTKSSKGTKTDSAKKKDLGKQTKAPVEKKDVGASILYKGLGFK